VAQPFTSFVKQLKPDAFARAKPQAPQKPVADKNELLLTKQIPKKLSWKQFRVTPEQIQDELAREYRNAHFSKALVVAEFEFSGYDEGIIAYFKDSSISYATVGRKKLFGKDFTHWAFRIFSKKFRLPEGPKVGQYHYDSKKDIFTFSYGYGK